MIHCNGIPVFHISKLYQTSYKGEEAENLGFTDVYCQP